MGDRALKEFGHPEYWNKRYENGLESEGGTYEWFRTFQKLRPFFTRTLPEPNTKPRILHLGCGNSVWVTWLALSTYVTIAHKADAGIVFTY